MKLSTKLYIFFIIIVLAGGITYYYAIQPKVIGYPGEGEPSSALYLSLFMISLIVVGYGIKFGADNYLIPKIKGQISKTPPVQSTEETKETK